MSPRYRRTLSGQNWLRTGRSVITVSSPAHGPLGGSLTVSHSHSLTVSHSHSLTFSQSHNLTFSHSHSPTVSMWCLCSIQFICDEQKELWQWHWKQTARDCLSELFYSELHYLCHMSHVTMSHRQTSDTRRKGKSVTCPASASSWSSSQYLHHISAVPVTEQKKIYKSW